MYTGREPLHVENSKMTAAEGVKFRVNNGFFVQRWVALLLAVLFAGCLLAVGLLVYYLAPRPSEVGVTSAGGRSAGVTGPVSKESVLLPRSVRPVYYEVELQPFLPPAGNSSFAGSVLAQVHVDQATSSITMHVDNITIWEQTVRVVEMKGHGGPGSAVAVERLRYVEDKQFVVIELKRVLTEHNHVNVSMKFLGSLNDDMAGFYRSSYRDENNNISWLAVSQFQPTDARRAFPCFDEPELKAKFNISLIRPSQMTSLSNMPIARSVELSDGWTLDNYETSVAMSTYLLGFVVCEFQFRAQNASNTEFRVWARPEAMGQVDYALSTGPRTLDFFQNYFGVKFPLPKQDMIAIPDFRAGAMENWGLVTYRESALLWDPVISSSANKQRVLTVVVHELAHQWFGNLVTPKWWDDLWLNEGFASYMETVGADHIEPAWKMLDQFVVNDLMPVFELDALHSSHPVSVPVNHPDEINEIFDSISYSKGASVIRMMHHFLGDKAFRKGLTSYLQTFSYKNAQQDDLWKHLSEASSVNGSGGIDVKAVMDSWTKQTGYPVVNVQRNYSSRTVTLTQARFYVVSKHANSSRERWHIPITYTTASQMSFDDTEPKLWFYKNNNSVLLSGNDTVPTSDQWMIFNVRMTSFYRVNYDQRNWQLLHEQLVAGHTVIDVTNRAQLLDDAMDLARAGLLDYDVGLNISSYLREEQEYVPWQTAIQNFAFIDAMLQYTNVYGLWKAYIARIITPIYQAIGFDESAVDSHLKRLNRANIIHWACKMGNEDCLKKSTQLYKQWMDFPLKDPISPNLKRIVVCSAIREGGEKEWTFAYQRYQQSNVGAEKDMLLYAMACSNQPWILGQYLEMSINSSSGIRKADSSSVFARVSSNSIGRFLAFDFIRDKWDVIRKMHGSGFFTISTMVRSVTDSLNTPFQLKELKEFVNEHKAELGTATRSFQQAVEETEANVKWMEQSYSKVANWLHNNQ